MIKCKRGKVVMAGTALTLLGEFGMIALSLRKTLLHGFGNKFDAETIQKTMDAAYNFRKEDETC